MKNTIAIIGDPHIQFNNPTSRVDEYFVSIVNKLKQVLDNNKYVICLGDLFSNPVLDIQATMILIEILSEYKNKGGKFIGIIGNHTIYNWNVKTLNKTTKGLLVKLGLMTIIDSTGELEDYKNVVDHLNIEDWYITSTKLNNPKPAPTTDIERSILLGHSYYAFERDKKHSFEFEDLKECGFKYIFFGHDHEPYKPKLIDGTWLYRPGSLGRDAAHKYNLTREISYYQLDLDTEEIRSVKVDHAPGSEVFSIEVMSKNNDPTPNYVYDMEELLKSFGDKTKLSISIKQLMIDNEEIPDEIVEFISNCYEACGIPFV